MSAPAMWYQKVLVASITPLTSMQGLSSRAVMFGYPVPSPDASVKR